MSTILNNFVADVRACYSGKNLLWQLLAVALTYVSVVSGFDWWWYAHTRGAVLQNWLFPAAILGGLLPIVLPVILFFVGKVRKDVWARAAAFMTAKAAIIGLLISSFYKIFTGRIPPPFNSQSMIDISRQFEFGFLRNGAFWGWPSSHATVAFAIAVTLFLLYKNNPFIKYSALLVALYIGIGVSTNIHWFSEFIAGAIIGSVIGVVIGERTPDTL